jgi:peptide/nickel transport system permease protein
MQAYLIRRLLLAIPTLVIITIILFGTVRLIPGDVVTRMVSMMERTSGGGGRYNREQLVAEIERSLGLDVPVHVQYARWLAGAVRGDLGVSLWSRTSVTENLLQRLPVSFELGLMALVISLVLAFPVGIVSATRPDTALDYVLRSISVMFVAVPGFWLGTMLFVYPSAWWGWAPPIVYTRFLHDPLRNLQNVLIPAFILGMWLSGITMRLTRNVMLEVLRQDYVRTAWSKGLVERVVVLRHALKNALIPIVTMIGLQVPVLIGGAVVIEYLFNFPGIGSLLVNSLVSRDYTVVSGINLFVAAFVLAANLLVDLSYAWLDPRIRFQ